MSLPHYLPSHSGFLPQTLNVSLRDSPVLSLCHPLYFPFLPPPPSIIIALTLEGQSKCHIPVREPVQWCMVGHPVPFQSPVWLWLTVWQGREDPSGQSDIRPPRWLMGTVGSLSAVSHLRSCVYVSAKEKRKKKNNVRIMSRKESQCNLEKWRATNWRGDDMMKQTERKSDPAFWKPLWLCASLRLYVQVCSICLCRSLNS